MANPILSVKNLSASYNEKIIENIFISLKKNEFITIIGKSGEGKTTLLNSIAGLKECSGEIKKPNNISMVFQNYSLFPWMNVIENISFGCIENLTKSEKIKKATGIIEKIGLIGKENYYPKELSGGQQQRVAIGRALMAEPELILLDEPFANLDSHTRLQMQNWMIQLAKANKNSTILVTHDVDEALLLSDRILLLQNKTISKEIIVPFNKPRKNGLRFTQEFQELKKEILNQF